MNRKLYHVAFSEYQNIWYAEIADDEDWAYFELNPPGFKEKKYNYYITLTKQEAEDFVNYLNEDAKPLKFTCKKCGAKYLKIEGEESNHICNKNKVSIHLGSPRR